MSEKIEKAEKIEKKDDKKPVKKAGGSFKALKDIVLDDGREFSAGDSIGDLTAAQIEAFTIMQAIEKVG